jgi:copper resistance protein B
LHAGIAPAGPACRARHGDGSAASPSRAAAAGGAERSCACPGPLFQSSRGRAVASAARSGARRHACDQIPDQLEVGIGKGREAYSWDGQFWYGGNINKLWLKSEGEGEFGGSLEAAEIQGLWSRAINPWFDLQAGVRQDFGEGPDRTHLVVGIQGLARYWFEVDGALFLSNKGDLTGRIEAEYDLRLTQQLILQPRVEVDFSLQDIPELGTGAGLSTGEIGARLRYEFYPGSGAAVIAPYIGINYERAFGDTADFRRADGERRGDLRLLLGVRTWF